MQHLCHPVNSQQKLFDCLMITNKKDAVFYISTHATQYNKNWTAVVFQETEEANTTHEIG